MDDSASVTLSTLTPGDRASIVRIVTKTPGLRQRLLEMGMTRGATIELIRFAPMGDPIEIRIKGYRLSLRKVEAESVLVTKEPK